MRIKAIVSVTGLAVALALVGPLAGLYERYHERSNNSQLLLGSRAGFAVSPRDALTILQSRHWPSTSLNASRAFRKASIPEGMPQ